MVKSRKNNFEGLGYKLLGALLICVGVSIIAYRLYQKPELPASLKVTVENLTLTNMSDRNWQKVEVYSNHPWKGLRVVLYNLESLQSTTFDWDDFQQVYEGGEFKRGPVFEIWVMVDGYESRKFLP